MNELQKKLDAIHQALMADEEIEEEEEEIIRKKNQEMLDRFNAINDQFQNNDKIQKASTDHINQEKAKTQATGSRLEQLEKDFNSTVSKMGQLFFQADQNGNDEQSHDEQAEKINNCEKQNYEILERADANNDKDVIHE